MNHIVGSEFFCSSEFAVAAIHASMNNSAFNCFAIMDKHCLDVLVKKQPWAIDELVEHSGRQIVG